ncbi:hypothetical protein LCGC14_1056590 [marine sediment metagenome]|uniref:Uncharacterized protein n=1 Tax=marine sediment metagenome TaxID=412755 RepID=A0A0F9MME9_9ZZZZ
MAVDFRAKKTIGNEKSKLKLKFTGFIKKITRRKK